MIVANMCLGNFFYEGYGYQENILPRYQKLLGHQVFIVAHAQTLRDGKKTDIESDYINEDGIPVKVIKYRKGRNAVRFREYEPLGPILDSISPDVIFVHGGQSRSLKDVLKYKSKHPNAALYIDNHADYYNSPVKGIKTKLNARFGIGYYLCRSKKYVDRYFGVTPWRCEFLNDVYGLPKEKIALLPMGGEDEQIHFENKDAIRRRVCEKYGIDPNGTFVICTGGKIDKTKNIHLLAEAVKELKGVKAALLVFGNVAKNFEDEFAKYVDPEIVKMIGWVDAKSVYDYFLSSDLVVFPGTHSVLWEQAVACRVPCVFKDWEGMHHVDIGGNCEFIKEDSAQETGRILREIISDSSKYQAMKANAEKKEAEAFLYSTIAGESLNKYGK